MTLRPSFWWLPNLSDFIITSEPSSSYNCIAWALGDDSQWFDPMVANAYWPDNLPNELTLDSIVELFRQAGYEVCSDGSLQAGHEKIAIYAKDGAPTHAARQLENGQWTSKLGNFHDIEHDSLEALQGDGYGEYGGVELFMVRPIGA
ncbi:MAG: hypothetical protein OXC95_06355 [Dehalococcoidia bacterium]|nr:hypothetical protein [Dehalococcoidia bacterium]